MKYKELSKIVRILDEFGIGEEERGKWIVKSYGCFGKFFGKDFVLESGVEALYKLKSEIEKLMENRSEKHYPKGIVDKNHQVNEELKYLRNYFK